MASVNTNLKRQTNHRCLGSTTLEAVFVLILLLMVTLGTMGYGWFFFRVQQVTNAARHGARVAVRYRVEPSDTVNAVENAVAGLLIPVNLDYEGPDLTVPTGPNSIGKAVTVSVKGKGLDILNLGSATLLRISIPDDFTSSVTMAQEGP